MIDASFILHQVQAEELHGTWRVIRPENQVRFITIGAAIAFTLSFNFCFIVVGTLILYNSSDEQFGNNLFDVYRHYPLPALFTQLVVILLSMFFRYRAINARDAIFLLLPEGIFHCKQLSNDTKRQMKFIAYKNIQRMTLDVSKGSDYLQMKVVSFDFKVSDPNSLQYKEKIPDGIKRFEFHFFYTNDAQETWFPPQAYERSCGEIAQWILNDYCAFALAELDKKE